MSKVMVSLPADLITQIDEARAGIPLVSADAMLAGAGLAETATRACQRGGLR